MMKHLIRPLSRIFGLVFLTASIAAPAASAPGNFSPARGSVSADGKPLAGAVVSIRARGASITTSVYSDSRGNYEFPPLPPGSYRLWAQAVGFARIERSQVLPTKRSGSLILHAISDKEQLWRQLPADEQLRALPQSTESDKTMVRILRSTCSDCHTPAIVLQQRFDENGWRAVIDLMGRFSIIGTYNGDNAKVQPDIAAHKEELVKYLTRIRGPGSVDLAGAPPRRPVGEASRVVFREYALPLDADVDPQARYGFKDGTDWAEGIPSQLIPGYQPHDAVADLQGNLWFTSPAPSHTVTFGRVDWKTGAVKLFKTLGHGDFAATTHGIARDKDGYLWTGPSTAQGALLRIDPLTQKLLMLVPPAPTGMSVSVSAAPDGKVWMSAIDGAVSYDPAHNLFAHYSVGMRNAKGEYDPTFSYGIAGDRNGNGWWSIYPIDLIGKAESARNASKIIAFPDMKEQTRGIHSDSLGLRRMAADPNGQYVWISASFTDAYLARVDMDTDEVKMVPVPDGVQPYQTAVDRKGNVWFNSWMTDKIVRYSPGDDKFVFFELPTHGTESRHLSILEREGQPTVIVLVEGRLRKLLTMTLNP